MGLEVGYDIMLHYMYAMDHTKRGSLFYCKLSYL